MPKQAVPVTANRGMAAPVVNKKYGEEDHFSEGDSGNGNKLPQLNPGTRGSINNPSDDANKSLIKRGKD